MSYMPSRAARWISAIALRSNVADSRSPGCHPFAALTSVRAQVVDVEVVEPPRGPVAPELAGVDIVDAGASQQIADLRHVLVPHLLLNAVRAEPGHRAAHVQPRLVQRVPERLARVATHHQTALLPHERAHVANRAADHDVGALQRDPAAR